MIPFEIDPETLRDSPVSPHEAWAQIGVAARMLREVALSEWALRRAMELNPTVATRLELARTLQWQERYVEAHAEFARCLESGELTALVHQHWGRCYYDQGNWSRALEHFTEAADPALAVEIDAADACLTAALVAIELHRLVPAVHRSSARPSIRPPHLWVLADVASLLPAPVDVVFDVHRYHAEQRDLSLLELAREGWIKVTDKITPTEFAEPFIVEINRNHAKAAAALWPDPPELKIEVDHPFAAAATGDHPAARLWDQLRALRYHRADAHAAAWQAEGLTVDGVRALKDDDPIRARIEAATDRMASRPYRALSRADRAALLATLRALPGESGQ
ncbi:hypothetical protein Lesp02_51910 [Lentzea sp. NBRC 105346]|uniref:tetratricopeptide repeat protein n=1 Tax=Lentzea sp. NBRC 105346 TaxID=3032205 RepID=UPI0024A55B72|nr:tetratricopeptide repeat protein [Lentzea sp. NBRC 105346]GLZ33003.1 hypothetical protein Lesp02_51910 [Lentzea sp. NBRC 105346]